MELASAGQANAVILHDSQRQPKRTGLGFLFRCLIGPTIIAALAACGDSEQPKCIPEYGLSELEATVGSPKAKTRLEAPKSIRLFLDISTGMKGFFIPKSKAGESNLDKEHRYAQLLTLVHQTSALRSIKLNVHGYGNGIIPIETAKLRDSLKPTCLICGRSTKKKKISPNKRSLYNTKTISLSSDLQHPINSINLSLAAGVPDTLHVITTDFFLNRDKKSLNYKLYTHQLQKIISLNLSFFIVGVKSRFNGRVYDIDHLRNVNNTEGAFTHKGYLPAYFIIIGHQKHGLWLKGIFQEHLDDNQTTKSDYFFKEFKMTPSQDRVFLRMNSDSSRYRDNQNPESVPGLESFLKDEDVPKDNWTTVRYGGNQKAKPTDIRFEFSDKSSQITTPLYGMQLNNAKVFLYTDFFHCDHQWTSIPTSVETIKVRDSTKENAVTVHLDSNQWIGRSNFIKDASYAIDMKFEITERTKRKSDKDYDKFLKSWSYKKSEEAQLVEHVTRAKESLFKTRELGTLFDILAKRVFENSDQDNPIHVRFLMHVN